ncbi:hypothetical protein ACFSCX_22295 [Bacillus salitolerans]|uniref:Uncharacterized protein n=1 Tax=Bacillus salitolerans TaxID=1437434 RepID=A0ABW4LVP3_9BACI
MQKGNDELIKIHDRLYTGILRNYLFREVTYIPRITVGRLKKVEEFSTAIEQTAKNSTNFSTVIREVVAEIITDEKETILEFKLSYKS